LKGGTLPPFSPSSRLDPPPLFPLISHAKISPDRDASPLLIQRGIGLFLAVPRTFGFFVSLLFSPNFFPPVFLRIGLVFYGLSFSPFSALVTGLAALFFFPVFSSPPPAPPFVVRFCAPATLSFMLHSPLDGPQSPHVTLSKPCRPLLSTDMQYTGPLMTGDLPCRLTFCSSPSFGYRHHLK